MRSQGLSKIHGARQQALKPALDRDQASGTTGIILARLHNGVQHVRFCGLPTVDAYKSQYQNSIGGPTFINSNLGIL